MSFSRSFAPLLLIIAGCSAPSTVEAPSEAEFKEWVETRYVAPFKAGEAEDWAQIFAENAIGLHNRREADIGKEAIESFGKMVASIFTIDEMDITVEELRINGNWAFTRGTYVNAFSFRETGEPAPWGREHGKFFFLWERQSTGEWKIIVDMGNSVE